MKKNSPCTIPLPFCACAHKSFVPHPPITSSHLAQSSSTFCPTPQSLPYNLTHLHIAHIQRIAHCFFFLYFFFFSVSSLFQLSSSTYGGGGSPYQPPTFFLKKLFFVHYFPLWYVCINIHLFKKLSLLSTLYLKLILLIWSKTDLVQHIQADQCATCFIFLQESFITITVLYIDITLHCIYRIYTHTYTSN